MGECGREAKNKGQKHKHLLRIEAEDLQTLDCRSTRQSNIALALLEHAAEVDLDTLYGLTLALVNGKGPRKDERDLVMRKSSKRDGLLVTTRGRKKDARLDSPSQNIALVVFDAKLVPRHERRFPAHWRRKFHKRK